MEKIRLQKYISDCGLMSRRAAEREISAGRILVNGERVELGAKISPDTDVIKYNGVEVKRPDSKRYNYIMLNKPVGYVTTMSDEQGRKCVAELVADVGSRVYPAGRLDLDSEGLLLLTDDGELTNKLTHPKHHVQKEYHVKINKEITSDELSALCKPMEIDGYKLKPIQAEVITRKENFTVLKMILHEGRNRQIRKMCQQVGLEIATLKRVAIGQIKLGDLRPGKWRRLTASQVEYLKKDR